jgi:hypothetical protein
LYALHQRGKIGNDQTSLNPYGVPLTDHGLRCQQGSFCCCQFTETHWEEALGRKAVAHLDPKWEVVITYAVSASYDGEVTTGTYRTLRPDHPVGKLVGVSSPNKATLVEFTGADNGFAVTIFHSEKDARGFLAVTTLHSVAYGLQQSVGFCR